MTPQKLNEVLLFIVKGSLSEATNLHQEGHWQAAYLTLQLGQWRQASLAEPRRFPTDFTGELRGQKPPRLHFLQETQNYLRREHVCITGHCREEVIGVSCEQLALDSVRLKLIFSNCLNTTHEAWVQHRNASVRKHHQPAFPLFSSSEL